MTADDPRILAGRYELIERLGSGGMASVWRAQDLSDCSKYPRWKMAE